MVQFAAVADSLLNLSGAGLMLLRSSSKGVATQPAVESVMSQIYVMMYSIPESSVYLDCSRGVLLRFYGSFCKASNSVRF